MENDREHSQTMGGDSLLRLLAQGMRQISTIHTTHSLGNRQEYIGMSDIAKGLDCLRAAVGNKLRSGMPPDNRQEESLVALHQRMGKELRLQRGHWFEQGVGAALTATGVRIIPQLEINLLHAGVPIKAHLDFVLVFPGPPAQVLVVECKSCERIPDTVYASHEVQIYGQIGLLKALWQREAFSVRAAQGQQTFPTSTFPNLAGMLFGCTLPEKADAVAIEGVVLAVSMSEVQVFGPYLPNKLMLHMALDTARSIWSTVEKIRRGTALLDAVSVCQGFHPLCDYCDENQSCPRFAGIDAPELETDLIALAALKAEKEAVCLRVQEAENRLKKVFQGISTEGEWISAITQRFHVATCEGRTTIDKDLLRSALAAHLDDESIEQMLSAAQKTGAPYERLSVSSIKR